LYKCSLYCPSFLKFTWKGTPFSQVGNNLAQLLRKYVRDIHWIHQASCFNSCKQFMSININCPYLTQKYKVHLTHFNNCAANIGAFRTNYGGPHKRKGFKATEWVQPPLPDSSTFTMLHCHFNHANQLNILLQLKMRSLWQQKIICINNTQTKPPFSYKLRVTEM
jgi:hypothetical protein